MNLLIFLQSIIAIKKDSSGLRYFSVMDLLFKDHQSISKIRHYHILD